MDKTLEKALKIMVLDYLKRRANKEVYNHWDRGGYGEVPLPKMPYRIDKTDDDVKTIITKLEQEVL